MGRIFDRHREILEQHPISAAPPFDELLDALLAIDSVIDVPKGKIPQKLQAIYGDAGPDSFELPYQTIGLEDEESVTILHELQPQKGLNKPRFWASILQPSAALLAKLKLREPRFEPFDENALVLEAGVIHEMTYYPSEDGPLRTGNATMGLILIQDLERGRVYMSPEIILQHLNEGIEAGVTCGLTVCEQIAYFGLK